MKQAPQLTFILVWPAYQNSALVQAEMEKKARSDIYHFFDKWKIPCEVCLTKPQNLSEVFKRATGQRIIITSAELWIPLGDLLKLLQALQENEKIQIAFGNRMQKKGSPFLTANQKRPILEKKLSSLFEEHLKNLFTDPLCPAVAFSSDLLPLIAKSTNHLAWPSALRKQSLNNQWRSAEIPVTDLGGSPEGYPDKILYLKYLWQSFRL